MGRPGCKRRLVIEDEYWELLQAGTRTKLEPFKDYLVARLIEFPELSAAALFEEICAMGYAGGISTLKDFTQPYRVRRSEPLVRFETPPGKQAQVDWAHLGAHTLDGKPTHLWRATRASTNGDGSSLGA